jgi:hypothetical protein
VADKMMMKGPPLFVTRGIQELPECYEIERNIPIPQSRSGSSTLPFDRLEIGDSFFAPGKTAGYIVNQARPHRPKKFTMRSVIENGTRGFRIWRIA